MPKTPLKLVIALAALLAPGCYGTRAAQDATVRVRTSAGVEQGVSTPYGVVFLGRTARSGRVELEVRYGDGESIESSVIEPVGGGLYTAEAEIRLPTVPLSFRTPRPGETLTIRGYGDDRAWETTSRVRADERVLGILLDVPSALRDQPERIGAGVYERTDDGLRLLGLVSGRVTLQGPDGSETYLTVAGPETLWRLVTLRRDHNRRQPWVYREDIR